MNYLLHIDTSTDIGAVAVGGDGVLIAHRTNTESRNHAATLNILINDVLADAKITLQDLAGIVVCAGPGSYTGLRIGMATAKGLCYALDKPLLLDNRLTLLAYQLYKQHPGAGQYISLLYAREREYFVCTYSDIFEEIIAPQHKNDEGLLEIAKKDVITAVITNSPDIIKTLGFTDIQIITDIQINFELWVFYSYFQYVCNNIVNLSNSEPFYLKQVYTHK
jgi:tRNA threonylcarbamoyladenosine biosynthesis protein TsaB